MQHSSHHLLFIVLSIVIAVLGSWTALDLFRRVSENIGRPRLVWLATAALAMGMSIWSMHFVAMLGFDPGSSVSYDPMLTIASLVLAIGSTAGAFFFVASETVRPKQIVLAGTAMGAGICTMHYVGMAALESAMSFGYDVGLVVLSLAIAVTASTAALFAARRERSARMQALAAVILGLAVVGMHYTAMAALKLTLIADRPVALHGAPPTALAIGIATLTVIILFLAMMASLYDQRSNILAALDAGGVGYWELDLRSRVLFISPKGKAIFGLGADDALTYSEALTRIAPDSRAERERQMAHAIATGEDYDVEYPLARTQRWVNARGRVAASRHADATRMVGIVLDVTDRRNAFLELEGSERRQRLLIDELNHRVKNTLSTVQSISRQTAKRATSLEQFHANFEARIMALSATHNALTRGGWETASLREMLDAELNPYSSGQVRLSGSDVDLPARHALSLGMVFHELATNAAKHGGLSAPGGRLEIAWGLQETPAGPILQIDWSEYGRAIAAPPTGSGFGSRLIRTSIEHELGGRLLTAYAPDGLRCTIHVPLGRSGDAGAD
ncbi:hypothetical protein ASG43_06045 [Aureimonas sp. Leaf454]|uniref:MHYT domain-containing protein n=1 Tax=Aureimonas sp. Leaf454 TaxID=1736381 RepID=UPI0007017E2E|nr:MHYT domain-containing protein [Aureimonas sp. Leaf454]KQT50823.1 hypothetical protein ASG43_06045 [Aureimonas sp. Leaf454]